MKYLFVFIVNIWLFTACDKMLPPAETDLLVEEKAAALELNLKHGLSMAIGGGTPVIGRPGLTRDDFGDDYILPGTPSIGSGEYGDDDWAPIVGYPAPYPVCGNEIIEPTEQCDDGNDDNMDGCNVICRLPCCGNGVLELDEECDDNNTDGGDGCSQDCLYERCGNKITETKYGEQCDDGNLKAGDGCSPCCKFEKCGNAILDPKEECDDGNNVNGDGCSAECLLEVVAAS